MACALLIIVAMMLSCTLFDNPAPPQQNNGAQGNDNSENHNKGNNDSDENNNTNSDINDVDDVINRFLLTSAPGLYNIRGRLVAPWDTLVLEHGFNCEKDYTANNLFTSHSHLFYIVQNNNALVNGVALIIDDSITRIGDGALALQSDLHAVVIPLSVTSIGMEAFIECPTLNKIVFRGTTEQWRLVELGECWSGYAPATTVVCSNGVIPIPVDAYYGFYSNTTGSYAYCGGSDPTKRTYVKIESEVLDRNKKAWLVARIEASAFENFETIDTLVIPASIVEIGDSAFSGCKNLTTIVFEGTTKQWNAITFGQGWNCDVPATHVQCSNGTVTLN